MSAKELPGPADGKGDGALAEVPVVVPIPVAVANGGQSVPLLATASLPAPNATAAGVDEISAQIENRKGNCHAVAY